MEKIVNMMEEAVVEQQLPLDEQQYWKNKILAHREYIRVHQDAVGKAMGYEAAKLKKKLNALEKKNRKLAEFAVSMGVDPEDEKTLKKTKKSPRSGNVQLKNVTANENTGTALIRRLRRDNEEFKRKIQSQQGDLRKLQNEKKPAGNAAPRKRGTKLNLDQTQIEEMLSRLKKENYELRNERNEIRKEKDFLQIRQDMMPKLK
eukprot:296432_1